MQVPSLRFSLRPASLPLAIAALVFGGAVATASAGQDREGERSVVTVQAEALEAPDSRVEGDLAMDGAVAAAVVGAISTRFDERDVAVKLDQVDVEPLSVRDRAVSGHGRMRIGEGEAWMPLSFEAVYDTRTATVGYPYLVLGDGGAGDVLDEGSEVAVELGERVNAALAAEFSGQPVELELERVVAAPAGGRYLRVQATGTADFDTEGTTAAQVQALYDQRTGDWIDVDYELGTTANWAGDQLDPVATSVATR